MKSQRVIVVDDQDDLRMMLRVHLEMQGHVVSEAANGARALEAIATDDPAIVFLDLQMPGMDGWSVLSSLRAAGALESVTVVAMSAYGDAAEQAHALQSGAALFVRKPFRFHDIDAALERLLS